MFVYMLPVSRPDTVPACCAFIMLPKSVIVHPFRNGYVRMVLARNINRGDHRSSNVRRERKSKGLWLSSGLAQVTVLVNGCILTIIAFFVLSYSINGVSFEDNKRASQESSTSLGESISSLETSMRIMAGIFLLSENSSKDVVATQIRRNIPDLSKFDQIILVYEGKPGNWLFKLVYENPSSQEDPQHFLLKPTPKFITQLVNGGYFNNEGVSLAYDFEGMEYVLDDKSRARVRPFALVKAVETGNSKQGIILGVSRATLLLSQSGRAVNPLVSRMTILDKETQERFYHLNRDNVGEGDGKGVQEYSFRIADREWQVLLGFARPPNFIFLEMIPYIALAVGIMMTAVGTLFVRNNYHHAARQFRMNQELEKKNLMLQSEVSERERLNNAIAKAEKENRALIDSVSDIIFETDTEGNILFLSAAWRKITGFDPERSIGNDLFSMLHFEEQDKQRSDFHLLVRGQKQAYRSFSRLRISDGTFRSVELAMSMIRQDENKSLRVVGTITDVEERRRAERALAEAEKKYRMIVENAAGGLFQITPEGMYLSANPAMARILGYVSVEEMLRLVKNANGLVYPNIEERKRILLDAAGSDQIFTCEVQVVTKDKTKIWVRENIRSVRDDQKNILYYEGSMEDITKRKEADIALREAKIHSDMANRAKTEFIANMSHELRTPLNAIIGFSEIIKNQVMGAIGQDLYVEYAKDIYDSGRSLLTIINEILDISKIEAGNRELNESEFQVFDALSFAKETLSPKAEAKSISIVDKTADLPLLIGEEVSVRQVFRNILSNAIQFTPDSGRVTLFSNFDHDGSFRISIADTGVGMSLREIEKAMSPFGQVDNALSRSSSGTGLGLPLAQALVKLHGGRIEVLSEKGIGTTVGIVFPAKRVVSATKLQKQDQADQHKKS